MPRGADWTPLSRFDRHKPSFVHRARHHRVTIHSANGAFINMSTVDTRR